MPATVEIPCNPLPAPRLHHCTICKTASTAWLVLCTQECFQSVILIITAMQNSLVYRFYSKGGMFRCKWLVEVLCHHYVIMITREFHLPNFTYTLVETRSKHPGVKMYTHLQFIFHHHVPLCAYLVSYIKQRRLHQSSNCSVNNSSCSVTS